MALFCITIAYFLGILSGLYWKQSIAFFVVLFFFLSFFLPKRKYIFIFIFCSLFSYVQIRNLENSFDKKYKGIEEVYVVGTIIEDPKEQEYAVCYTVKVESVNHDVSYANTYLLVKVKKEKEEQFYSYGNKISFTGTLEEASGQRNEGGFNYKQYLKTKKIYGIVTTRKKQIQLEKESNVNVFLKMVNISTNQIKRQINKLLPQEEASLLQGLLIGNKEALEEEIQEAFRKSNLSHMLAVSGAHVSYVSMGISFLLAKSQIGKRKSKWITILLLLFFMLLTGKTSSVSRACYMAIYLLVASLCHKRVPILASICFSMLLLLVSNPYCIFDIGFQLSYGGTLGIIILYPVFKKKRNMPKKGIEKIKDNIFLTLSANVILFPILLFHFNTISLTFLISNLLAAPIMGILVIFGFVLVFLSFFFFPLAKLGAIPLRFLLKVFLQIALFTSKLPCSQILLPTPKIHWILFYYCVFAIFLLKRKQKKKIEGKKVLAICLILSIGVLAYRQIPTTFQIHFIDVGQGDSTFIITPKKRTILIDGGGSEDFDVGEKILIPYLLDKGITNLQYVFISHLDSDHVKGIFRVLEKLKVENVILSKQIENSQNYEILQKIVKKKKLKVIFVKKGDEILLEPEIKLKILWPEEEQIQENALNNNSIVAKLEYRQFSFLLTGDIEQIAEEKLIEEYKNTNLLEATLLKVAHHGSKTSSTQAFLEQVKPKLALLGVGKKNTFGHPSQIVLERLEKERNASISNRS